MLSGRARLYSFNDPPTQAEIGRDQPPAEQWAIVRLAKIGPESALGQALRGDGFEEVFRGKEVAVLRRVARR